MPTMAGNIPPFVIASVGGFVRKSRLIALMPFLKIKNNIEKRPRHTVTVARYIKKKAKNCLIFLKVLPLPFYIFGQYNKQ